MSELKRKSIGKNDPRKQELFVQTERLESECWISIKDIYVFHHFLMSSPYGERKNSALYISWKKIYALEIKRTLPQACKEWVDSQSTCVLRYPDLCLLILISWTSSKDARAKIALHLNLHTYWRDNLHRGSLRRYDLACLILPQSRSMRPFHCRVPKFPQYFPISIVKSWTYLEKKNILAVSTKSLLMIIWPVSLWVLKASDPNKHVSESFRLLGRISNKRTFAKEINAVTSFLQFLLEYWGT